VAAGLTKGQEEHTVLSISSFRRFAVLVTTSVAISGMLLSGCGGSSNGGHHKKMTTVFVQLNWLPNVEFSGLWVADHMGWFKRAGFNLTYKPFANGISPEQATTACWKEGTKLCFGFDDSAAVAINDDQGAGLKAVWVGSQKTPFGFVTCAVPANPKEPCTSNSGKNITSPAQWKNLKIGYQSDELYVPEIMLGSVGLSLSDVKPTVVEYNPAILTNGGVDAFLVFINNEPISMGLQGIKLNVIPAYKFGMRDFYADAMFAPDAELTSHAAQVKTFVHLVDKGWKYAMRNSTTVADMVAKYYFPANGTSASTNRKQQELEEKQFATMLSRNANGQISGQMTLGRWKRIEQILGTSSGNLGGGPLLQNKPWPKPSSLFTNEFAPPPSK
jgi:ABC-type nitrate/sulfonate/bicarbonate transport system substrate-binding protein